MIEFSFIVPLYNEQDAIIETIETLLSVGENELQSFEIIVINDASKDNSYKVLRENYLNNSRVIVLNNLENIGFAESYKKGLRNSKGAFIQYIPADNAIDKASLSSLLKERTRGKAVLQYCTNPYSRPCIKALISNFYGKILNFLTGNKIKYYNGLHIFPGDYLRELDILENSFAFQAEIVLKAIESIEYTQVGIQCTFTDSSSSALKADNIKKILKFIFKKL